MQRRSNTAPTRKCKHKARLVSHLLHLGVPYGLSLRIGHPWAPLNPLVYDQLSSVFPSKLAMTGGPIFRHKLATRKAKKSLNMLEHCKHVEVFCFRLLFKPAQTSCHHDIPRLQSRQVQSAYSIECWCLEDCTCSRASAAFSRRDPERVHPRFGCAWRNCKTLVAAWWSNPGSHQFCHNFSDLHHPQSEVFRWVTPFI